MGCDIHCEVQVKHRGVWKTAPMEPFRERSYSAFAFLANVRNYGSEITPLSEPRGLPEDYDSIWHDRWEADAHSHSWFSAKEMSEVKTHSGEMKEILPSSYRWGISDVGYLQDSVENGIYEDARVVFWFDN